MLAPGVGEADHLVLLALSGDGTGGLYGTVADRCRHEQLTVNAKAKVEAGVLLAERWIMARLRNRRFTNLAEANLAIADLVEWINARPFKKLDGSRRSLFEEIDRPALRPLPAERYGSRPSSR